MDKHKRQALKFFEDPSTSDEDPYRDDGEYGSDQDYNPSREDSGSNHSSETSLLSQPKRSRHDKRNLQKKAKRSPIQNQPSEQVGPTSNPRSGTSSSSSSNSDNNSNSGSDTSGDSSDDSTSIASSNSNKTGTLSNINQASSDSDSSCIFTLSKNLEMSFQSKKTAPRHSSLETPGRILDSYHTVGSGSDNQLLQDDVRVAINEVLTCEPTRTTNQVCGLDESMQIPKIGTALPSATSRTEESLPNATDHEANTIPTRSPSVLQNVMEISNSVHMTHECGSGQPSRSFENTLSESMCEPQNENVLTESIPDVPQPNLGPSNFNDCVDLNREVSQQEVNVSLPLGNIPLNDHPQIQVTGEQSHIGINVNRIRVPSPTTNEGWQSTTLPIPQFDFDHDSVGVQFPIDENTTALNVFNYLFPEELIDFIVDCTNAYGQELCKSNRPKTRHSRSHSFKPTDREEMKKFLGLCLLCGQVDVPQKRKLFTLSDVLYYHPIFVSIMSGRRFEQLLRCLYVAPLNSRNHEKISEFLNALTRNFRRCFNPEKELSLDESLLLFRGRLSFRQYIKSKKARYGIKFYELTSASAYVLNLIMYRGKDESVEKGKKTEKIVMRLMRPYLLKGHELYMDNYYNSAELSEKLLDLRTHTTGTLRVNRKGNPDLLKKKLRKGQHVWTRKNRVYVSKWVDKRAVHMITTKNHPKMIDLTNRHGQPKRKPEEVTIYNQFMSGIDRADQMVSYYSSPRKTLRWYKKVFFHLLDLAVWNSYYIYKRYCKNNSKTYGFLCYRDELIRNLIKVSPEQKPESLIRHSKYDNRTVERVQGLSSGNIDTGNGGHWPEKIPVPAGSKKRSNYLKCKMCSKKKLRRETGLRCKGCTDLPALCALCFEEWHSQL